MYTYAMFCPPTVIPLSTPSTDCLSHTFRGNSYNPPHLTACHALSFNMVTARFLSGASLFVLLIVDICCFPYKKGFNPDASYGSSYPNAAPVLGSYQGAPSGLFSPAVVMPNKTPSKGIAPSYQAEPQPGSSAPQPIAQRVPVPSVASISSSGPVFSGYGDTSVRKSPAGSIQPGAAFQPGPQDNWASPSLSGGEALAPVFPEEVRPIEPMYQAGMLSQFEKSFDYGNNERETEQQGRLPGPPPLFLQQEYAGQGFISQPNPDSNIAGSSLPYPYPYPYPYYDFMFLTGQYPPGTVSHASNSYEHGSNYYDDVHYVRDDVPEQPMEPFTRFVDPQSFKDPYPVMAGYRQGGGAQAGGPASSHGRFRQPVGIQAGGHNLGKGGY
ncbi:uncharacterized protein LOC142962434 isoform X1 [Anarhichas minor]|uniref:uncharacterized protein LOC142962434 isoform X1 n=2 Tax=Anarhichas minor TaxID=65739 RepID=UPI003F740A34